MNKNKAKKSTRKNSSFSIGKKITLSILLISIACNVLLGLVCTILSYKASMDVLSKTMNGLSSVAAERVSAELQEYLNIAVETGSIARLANPDLSPSEKENILKQRTKDHDFLSAALIDTNGKDIFQNVDVSEDEYFKKCMQGTPYISDPIMDQATKELTVIVAAPLWENGIPDTKPVGVIAYTTQPGILNKIMATINVGKSGYAYMINKTGLTIAHKNPSGVGTENTMEDAKTNSKLKKLAELEKQMTEGKDGYGYYTYGGVSKILSFSPVPETNGWSIAICAEKSEFMSFFYASVSFIIILVIVFIIIGLLVGAKLGKSISLPISRCVSRLQLLSKGDLTSEIPAATANDETKLLLDALVVTIAELKSIVTDIEGQVGELAKGNLCIAVDKDYNGDFLGISHAIRLIIDSLNSAIKDINENSERVSKGSNDLAGASQALAEGASDQASAIEELTATVTNISDRIQENADNAVTAKNVVKTVDDVIMDSNEQMKQMAGAMEKIEQASKEIANIIKTIEDIATQTNLLSLNAAIEAARAGEAGKGFAVVADEVRSLAEQSSKAAKNTTELIQNAITAIEEGTALSTHTADSLHKVVAGSKDVQDKINEIASASNDQALAIEQISEGINQIAGVVQTNSATAEESAASSEELASEAESLKALVERFKYKKE